MGQNLYSSINFFDSKSSYIFVKKIDMKKSNINVNVVLDDNNIPEQLSWSASDVGGDEKSAKAINISIWDHVSRETLKMDLWAKDMSLDEMKIFYVDMVGSMAESLRHSTGDAELSKILDTAGKNMMNYIEENFKK